MTPPEDGGDNTWGTTDDDYGDLHVTAGCIDAGTAGKLPADTTDIDNDGDFTEDLPFDKEGNPSELLLTAQEDRLKNWRSLQELAGLI